MPIELPVFPFVFLGFIFFFQLGVFVWFVMTLNKIKNNLNVLVATSNKMEKHNGYTNQLLKYQIGQKG